ncbi:hypothetical protein GGP41_001795 [Bipolaris sorokiniana]|uniref:Uncharacterized protein n=1 Tax=Cochliobolus sativus TaxID=45130 RepID=A0A8H6DYQ4_COCSA|nr:hypothetical protein GGP41_001795 [Bipolaris sorokiniana]
MTEALLLRTFPLATFMIKVRYYGVGSVAFKNIRNSILDTLIASTLDGRESVYQKKTPVVHECFLSWCVRTIKSLYDLSEYHKNPLSFFYNSTNGPNTWISRGIPEHQGGGTWIEYKKNITITTLVIDPTHTNYSIEYGSTSTTSPQSLYSNTKDFYFAIGPSQRDLRHSPWLAPNNITQHVERLTTAMADRPSDATRSSLIYEKISPCAMGMAHFSSSLARPHARLLGPDYDDNREGYTNGI